MKNIDTVVIDAGARFGLHPTWKSFSGEMKYYMFDPDTIETDRLKQKYAHRASDIFIFDKPLTKVDGESFTINYFKNRAMSSSSVRNELTELFKNQRKDQVEIESSKTYVGISIDTFSKENNIAIDFLKLDTEGSEYYILNGAITQLNENILGVRSEIAFDNVFENMPLFSDINSFMLKMNFFLLNIDYTGRGDNQSEFIDPCNRYGILTNSDAVWLKRYDVVISQENNPLDKVIKTIKYAYFCILNNAPDVAIKTLLDGKNKYALEYSMCDGTALLKNLQIAMKKHLYSLKWIPSQNLEKHYDLYREIFHEEMEKLDEFMASIELNPS